MKNYSFLLSDIVPVYNVEGYSEKSFVVCIFILEKGVYLQRLLIR